MSKNCIQPFKNRTVDYNKPVELYRCLNRKGFTFSLRQGGVVVGHTNNIILKDCDLVVNKSGKLRCITEKKRNVHAFVRGVISEEVLTEFSYILRYNPYERLGFHLKIYDELLQIDKCKTVYLQENKIYCQI